MSRIRTMEWSVYCIFEDCCEASGPCKIGVTTDMSKRLSSLQGGNYRPLVVAWILKMPTRSVAFDMEAYCLSFLRPNIYGGRSQRRQLKSEWVDGSPTEAIAHVKRRLDAYLADESVAA